MPVVTAHQGRLLTVSSAVATSRVYSTGLAGVDAIAPGHGLAGGCVHELLHDPQHPVPSTLAALFARVFVGGSSRQLVWFDAHRALYPTALWQLSLPLSRVLVLHPRDEVEQLWSVEQCLRSTAVGAVVAFPRSLNRLQARKFQLAAETGQGAGILVRATGTNASIYAATTRWLCSPAPGESYVQRWKVELIHGHGGQVHSCAIVEVCRETNHVRTPAGVADRSHKTSPQRKRA